jgi:proline iminopeptidase
MNIFLFILLALLIFAVLYAAYAYHAYHRVALVARACRDCASPVTVDGYDLYYRELGVEAGLPPVVLVHGGPGHSSLSFKNSLDFLAKYTRVVYYDQRGSGNSQVKPERGEYTIEKLVEELEALRRDVLKAEKMILVGHSFGSALVQRYALKYPARVEKILLVGGIRVNNGMVNRWLWKGLGPALYSLDMGFPPPGVQAADEWFKRSAEKDVSRRLYHKSNTALLQDSGPISFVPWFELSLSMVGPDYRAALRNLAVPTLFLYGVADIPYTGKPVAEELCALLPDCRAVGFAHSGHWPFLEEPERFQQVVAGFLELDGQRLERASAGEDEDASHLRGWMP